MLVIVNKKDIFFNFVDLKNIKVAQKMRKIFDINIIFISFNLVMILHRESELLYLKKKSLSDHMDQIYEFLVKKCTFEFLTKNHNF